MLETLKLLKGDFVVLDLGSAHSKRLFRKHEEIATITTLIEIDALAQEGVDDDGLHRRIALKKAVSGQRGKRIFTRRKFPDCSSFPEPDPRLIEAYGVQRYYEKVGTVELDCEPISVLLQDCGISRVDFFKTDLEGMDFEVLTSAPGILSQALCVQSELRFQPFYENEPHFHKVAAHLTELGFELISLRPEVWKYATAHQSLTRDGRLTWADTVFFLSAPSIRQAFGNQAWKCFTKQIILAKLLGLNNYAEHLCETHASQFPDSIRMEMQKFVLPDFSLGAWLAAKIIDLPLGWMFLGGLRRIFAQGCRTTSLYRDKMLGTQ